MVSHRAVLYVAGALLLASCSVVAIQMRPPHRRPRRFKTRPLNRKRQEDGHFASLVRDMLTKEHDYEQYIKYTRMTPNLFNYLLEIVGPSIQKDVTKNPLTPAHRLMMTLHYLASGSSMQEIAWNYRVGKTTVHDVIGETCEALWNLLMPIVLEAPTQEWNNIAAGFLRRWNIPHCVGAIDGKHVNIQCPKKSGSQFFNYKKSFSIVLMAACDSQYRFILVDVGAYGSNHDSVVFRESNFGEALLTDQLNLPLAENLPNTEVTMDYFMVADQAFPLHTRIMRPFPGQFLDNRKKVFNYRLSRGRRTIENTFGILVQRWRILRSPLVAGLEMCEKIVKATIVLHNFLQKNECILPQDQRRYCPAGFADSLDQNGDIILGSWREEGMGTGLIPLILRRNNNSRRHFQESRNILADYFSSVQGSVPWQGRHVSQGSVPANFNFQQ